MSCRYTTKTELSPRQSEIIAMIAEGLSNDEIAAKLFISENTAKQHIGDVYVRLGARNRAHAVHLAHEAGALPLAGGS